MAREALAAAPDRPPLKGTIEENANSDGVQICSAALCLIILAGDAQELGVVHFSFGLHPFAAISRQMEWESHSMLDSGVQSFFRLQNPAPWYRTERQLIHILWKSVSFWQAGTTTSQSLGYRNCLWIKKLALFEWRVAESSRDLGGSGVYKTPPGEPACHPPIRQPIG